MNMHENQYYRSRIFSSTLILMAIILLAVLADRAYQLPTRDSLLFVLAIFIVFYIPGDLILELANLKAPLSGGRFIYANAIGLAFVSIAYLLWRKLGVDLRYLHVPFIIMFFSWLVIARLRWKNKDYANLTHSYYLSLAILVIPILSMLHFTHFSDVILTTDGFDIRSSHTTETVFHQGIINSLADNFPPPPLYASGITDFSHYHLGMHLQIELIHRLFGISTINLIYFYFIFFYFFLLSSLCFTFVRSIGGNWLSAILGGLLIYGSDFSFVTGIANDIKPPIAWVLLFMPGVFALFTYNGIIPGTIAFFTSILLFKQFIKKPSFATVGILTVVVISAYIYKSSLGLHLAVAYTCVGLIAIYSVKNRASGLILTFVFTLLTLSMLWVQLYHSGGIGSNVVEISPFNMFTSALERIGLSEQPAYQKPLLYFMFFIVALGIRYLGFHVAVKTNWNMKVNDLCVTFIVIFFICGYAISDFFFIGIEGEYNNAIWFASQAFFAAWVLVFYFLVGTQRNRNRHFLAILVIAILAFPSTIQLMAARYVQNYVKIKTDDIELIESIKNTELNSVILHSISIDEPSLASNFAGRSSVINLHHSFLTAFLKIPSSKIDVENRYHDVELFFSESVNTSSRNEILNKYNVNYLYCRRSQESCADLDNNEALLMVMSNVTYNFYAVSPSLF